MEVSSENVLSPAVPSLPAEMWEEVVRYIKDKPSLKSLCLVSKTMYSVVQPQLWLTVCVKAGAMLHVNYLPIQHLKLKRNECTDECLTQISLISGLKELNISGNVITSAGLHHITGLDKLTHINLHQCQLDDAAIIELSNIESLQSLNISYNKNITFTGLSELSKLGKIRELCLVQCELDDRCMSAVSRLTSLTSLDISDNADLSCSALLLLSSLTKLQYLQMYGCQNVTAAVIQNLCHLPLLYVNLAVCNIDDACLTALAGTRTLIKLNIRFNRRLTAAGMQQLSRLAALTHLHAGNCELDDSCIEALVKIRSLVRLDIGYNDRLTSHCVRHLSMLQHLKYLNIQECRNINKSDMSCIQCITYT